MPSLSNLRIAVTRPQSQADTLVAGIEERGGKAIRFPLLEIQPLEDPSPLNSLLRQTGSYHIAIFISPNAVQYGLSALSACNATIPALKIAAIGSGTARALHANGYVQVIVPTSGADSESLLALSVMKEVAGKRILIFRGDSGRELLGSTLAARGAEVTYAPCYRRLPTRSAIQELLSRHPQTITLSSSEALSVLWEKASTHERSQLLNIPLFVIHERIALAARKLGWQNVNVSTGGDAGLLLALENWAKRR